MRPIRSDTGAHVANAAFVVDPPLRRHGIGSQLAAHAVEEARRLGFRAMQFGFVPSTNTGSIALWQRLGFTIVGTLPGCYRDARRGDVDAYVLHRDLRQP
jgi:ribosomal protein S18 acetylase RimI-like enzyme